MVIKKNIYLFLLLILSTLIIWPLFLSGYFSHHDDLQVMRIFEMRKCFEDFQIPCRWVPDMGYGNGYPLFNYYNPFPYYIGAILSYFFGFVVSAKFLFLIPAILGGVSMYLLCKSLFDEKAAFVAALLYQFAPYKALDLYVRGDVTESFAIAIIPLVFYFAYKLVLKISLQNILGLSLTLGIFLTSHNIMVLFFLPLLILFIGLTLVLEKSQHQFDLKNILIIILSFILGVGLAAYFILPAFLEKDLVQIENLIRLDLNFRAHFVTFKQLFFDRLWQYGASTPGTNDTISFQIGWPHWWIVLISTAFIFINIKKKSSKYALFAFLVFVGAVFMTHIKSAFIWEKIDLLKFVQFPWRFLSVAVFCSAILGGYLINISSSKYKLYLLVIISVLTIILNFSFFKPEKFFYEINDQQKLSGVLWDEQTKAAILDYLPNHAIQPREPAPSSPLIKVGKAEVLNYINRSNEFSFNVKVGEATTLEVPVFDFQNWQVLVNKQRIQHFPGDIGRIAFKLEPGNYLVEGEFKNTLVRNIANAVTLFSLAIILGLVLYGKGRKIFR